MKDFFKITKFKLVTGVTIFALVFALTFVFNKVGYNDSLFAFIFQPAKWLSNIIGEFLNQGRTICPFLPPCFKVYPLWIVIISFVVVFYFYSAIIELVYKIVKKKS